MFCWLADRQSCVSAVLHILGKGSGWVPETGIAFWKYPLWNTWHATLLYRPLCIIIIPCSHCVYCLWWSKLVLNHALRQNSLFDSTLPNRAHQRNTYHQSVRVQTWGKSGAAFPLSDYRNLTLIVWFFVTFWEKLLHLVFERLQVIFIWNLAHLLHLWCTRWQNIGEKKCKKRISW